MENLTVLKNVPALEGTPSGLRDQYAESHSNTIGLALV